MMPMWMSFTGSKSGSPFVHEPSGLRLPTVCPVIGLMHTGSTSRRTKSGTAAARICCLSAIDDELSIMNKRSIFDTLFCLAGVTMRALTVGFDFATGRSRQPTATTAIEVSARAPQHTPRRIRPRLNEGIVWLLVSAVPT
jgi:hypothetical protein